MTLTNKLNLNKKSIQNLKRALHMEALESRQMLSAVSLASDAPSTDETSDSAYFADAELPAAAGITVTVGGEQLEEGVDYTVTYGDSEESSEESSSTETTDSSEETSSSMTPEDIWEIIIGGGGSSSGETGDSTTDTETGDSTTDTETGDSTTDTETGDSTTDTETGDSTTDTETGDSTDGEISEDITGEGETGEGETGETEEEEEEVSSGITVTISEDIVDDTDGETSLREALDMVEDGGLIVVADDVEQIILDEGIFTSKSFQFDGSIGEDTFTTIDCAGCDLLFLGDVQFSNTAFADASLYFGGNAALSDVDFVNSEDTIRETSETDSLIENAGSLILVNVTFDGISYTFDSSDDEWYGVNDPDYARGQDDDCDCGEDGYSFSFIENYGTMYIDSVSIQNADITFVTDRLDNYSEFSLIYNAAYANLTVDGLIAGENSIFAKTNRGDVGAVIVGIDNEGLFTGANILMYGNEASYAFDPRFEDIEENAEALTYGIATFIKDVSLTNVTILDNLYSFRADYYMANSIYADVENELERGFIVAQEIDGVEAPNLVITEAEQLEAIFPQYDADENTFDKDGDGVQDYRMWLNSEIVNAGDNDFVYDLQGTDAIGNPRINNEIVDLGAVEAYAEKLVVENLLAVPNAEDPTGAADLTWDAVTNTSGYILRYYTGPEALTEITEDQWTYVKSADELADLHLLVDGLDPKTWVAFQVMALGDNLSYLDSDWSETASCWTKSPFPAPSLLPALESPLAIDLSWYFVPGASSNTADNPYTIQYCVKPESLTDLDDAGSLGDDAWITLPSSYTLMNHYGALLVSNALNVDGLDGENVLEYNTTYLFRIKTNGVGDFVDSEWTYAEKKTGAKLVAPPLEADERTDTEITITWNDEINKDSQIKSYELQYREKGTSNWITVHVPNGADADSYIVDGLKETTTYEFRIRVLGQQNYDKPDEMADDSEWSDIIEATTKTKLAAPEPEAEAVSSTQINVTWEAVENADSYLVEVFDNDGNLLRTQEVSGTVGFLSALNPDTIYNISVTAIAAIDGEYVNSDPGTTEAQTWIKLTAPVMTQSVKTENVVTMTWEELASCNGYEVEFSLTGPDADDFEPINIEKLTVTVTEDGVEIEDLDSVRQIWFRIRAIGIDGISESSEWSTEYVGTTKGKLVFSDAGLSAEATSTSTIDLTWDAVAGATSYKISYKTGNGNQTWVTISDPTQTSTTIQGLNDDTPYDFTIQAIGDGENSVSSDVISASATTWLQLEAPNLDGELTIGETTISGTITPVDFAASYTVQVSTDGRTWIHAEMDGLNFTVENLDANTTYQIRMMAVGSASDSITVGEVTKISVSSGWNKLDESVTTLLNLDAPVLSYEDLTSNSVTLTWNEVENASGYWLVVTNTTTGETVFEGEVTETSKDFDLSPNREYSAVVKALGNGENIADSENSNTVSFATPKGQLANITLTGKYDGINDEIDLDWNDIAGAESYTLQYKAEGDAEWTEIQVNADTSEYTFKPVDAETTYLFIVTANADADNESSVSNEVSVTTPAKVDMTAVVLRKPSANGQTTIPTTELWVDEWTDVYVEVWVDNANALADGREFGFTTEFADMYTIVADEQVSADGIIVTDNGDGTWTVKVDGYEGGSGAAMLVRIKLSVNTANGINWNDRVNEDAYLFQGENINTDVYAVPGDMNDDGEISMTQDQADDEKFDAELGKENSWADFNHDGYVNLHDRYWMLESNQKKSWEDKDSIIYPEGTLNDPNGPFKYSPVLMAEAPAAPTTPTETPMQEMPEEEEEAILPTTGPEALIVNPIQVDEADPIPVVKDENTLTNNEIQKDAVAEASEKAEEVKLLDALFAVPEDYDFFA